MSTEINSTKIISNSQQTIAVKVSVKGEKSIAKKHPWIFETSIIKLSKKANTGDLCIIFSKKANKVIGIGLFDADSSIRIKLIHFGNGATINNIFFKEKINNSFNKRKELLQTNTNAYRLIFGENDEFPGLIADVYNEILAVKLYSNIWIYYIKFITKLLLKVSNCKTLIIRLSRNIKKHNLYNINEGSVIGEKLENSIVHFTEHGINFSANVIQGHKTGYFLDHRHNRKQIGELSKDKTVLDVFCYAGGFSVHALANNAKEVTSIDISKQALEVAKYNANLNAFTGKHYTLRGDAFKILDELIEAKKKYDVVVIDPPSFTKQQSQIKLALKKYKQLAQLGVRLVKPQGILFLASCSSRIDLESFTFTVEEGLHLALKPFKLLETTTHDIDHPITFKEGAYLKSRYYRIVNTLH